MVPSASAPRRRKSAEFLFQVPADFSAERHSPFWARARQCRNLFSLAHPPSLFQAVLSGTASASALNDSLQASGIPAALVWQSSLSCARVPSWPWCTTTPHFGMDLLGRGTGYWEIHIYILPSVSSLHALFQTLRRHRYRLLRQRLFSFTSSRVVVASGIVFQLAIAAKRGTSDLVGSGRRWSRLDWAAAHSEQSCCRHGDVAEETFPPASATQSSDSSVPPAGPRPWIHLWRFLRRVSFLAPLSSCFPWG